MTLREKARLRRIIKSNAEAYREARRIAVIHVMRGDFDEGTLRTSRWDLTSRAMYIAEAVASLEDHAEEQGES